LQCLQASLLEAVSGRERASAELEATLSALGSAKRQLAAYREENAALLASYDDWLAGRTGGAQRGAMMWHRQDVGTGEGWRPE
jgi:hypothetical protein